jgi:hypothetical protein
VTSQALGKPDKRLQLRRSGWELPTGVSGSLVVALRSGADSTHTCPYVNPARWSGEAKTISPFHHWEKTMSTDLEDDEVIDATSRQLRAANQLPPELMLIKNGE